MQTKLTLSIITILLLSNQAQAEEHKSFSEHIVQSINHVAGKVDDSMGYVVEAAIEAATPAVEMAPYVLEAAANNSLDGPFLKSQEFKEKKILFWKEQP